MPRAFLGIVRLCAAVPLLACGRAVRPSTLEACLDRPRYGYATPALKRRLKQCAQLVRPSAPPPAWRLAVGAPHQ